MAYSIKIYQHNVCNYDVGSYATNMYTYSIYQESFQFCLYTVCDQIKTRTPAFWGYPPPPHNYPYHWVILDSKSKEEKVKVTNLKNSPKFKIFEFWNEHYTPHLLKLLDKMCKYEMDAMSIVEDTERTRFCPQTDRRTRWYQYTPLSTLLKRGV